MAHQQKSGRGVRDIAHKVYRFLTAERGAVALMGGVAIAVAFLAAIMLGWGFISGAGAYWQRPLYDAGAHLGGWLAFKQDAWRFPIFDTIRMGYPDGTSIILTDSIPLVALVAKLVGLGLWGNWQYFGLFVFGAYILNGVSLVWLLRQMGVRNMLGALCAVVFACFTTLFNIQFESFYAQFFVIFSLGFYFRLLGRYNKKEMAIFIGLVLAALLVHPYLFAMSAVMYAVTIVTIWRRGALTWRRASAWLGAFVVLVAVLYVVAGFGAHPATGYQEQLYGKSTTFALDPTTIFSKTYTVDEIGVYLGLGFWLLVITGLVAARNDIRQLARRHVWLMVAAAGFLLFALTNSLFWNGHQVFHIGLPSPLLAIFETFRASKRFVVPLYYLAVAVAVALVLRRRSMVLAGVIVVAMLLQVADVSYYVRDVHASTHEGQPVVLNQGQWQTVLTGATQMQVFPSYSCLFDYRKTPLSQQWPASLELNQIAANEHVISNSVRASRRTKDCNTEAVLSHLAPDPGSVYVYFNDDNKKLILQPSPECLAHRVTFSLGIYCKGQ